MANKAIEFVIRGTVDWCKLLGNPRPYAGDPKFDKGPSWSVEINPDEKSRATLAKYGLDEKLRRDKGTKRDGSPTKNPPRDYDYLRLTVLESRDGKKNKPPMIEDSSRSVWNSETEIGNGSVADVLVRYVDYGTTKGLYYKKMRVLKLVQYEGGSDFEPLSEDDEFFGAEETQPDYVAPADGSEDLDDEVPY